MACIRVFSINVSGISASRCFCRTDDTASSAILRIVGGYTLVVANHSIAPALSVIAVLTFKTWLAASATVSVVPTRVHATAAAPNLPLTAG